MKPNHYLDPNAPEPYDYRKIDSQDGYMKCRAEGPYWNTEGILNNRVPYEKDLLNGKKFFVNNPHSQKVSR